MGTNISYIRDKKNEKGITPKSNDNTRKTETAVVKIHFFRKSPLAMDIRTHKHNIHTCSNEKDEVSKFTGQH